MRFLMFVLCSTSLAIIPAFAGSKTAQPKPAIVFSVNNSEKTSTIVTNKAPVEVLDWKDGPYIFEIISEEGQNNSTVLDSPRTPRPAG